MSQKTAVPFFTNANGTQKFFSIKMFFPRNGGKRFALAWAFRAHTHFLKEIIFIEKNFSVPFAFVKNGLPFFETFGLPQFEFVRV